MSWLDAFNLLSHVSRWAESHRRQAGCKAKVKPEGMFWVRGADVDTAMKKMGKLSVDDPEHDDKLIDRFVASLSKESLASIKTYADIRLRYTPRLNNGSDP